MATEMPVRSGPDVGLHHPLGSTFVKCLRHELGSYSISSTPWPVCLRSHCTFFPSPGAERESPAIVRMWLNLQLQYYCTVDVSWTVPVHERTGRPSKNETP